jgi:DNA helicase-2/ATP-dependent DNA helicase PcrA
VIATSSSVAVSSSRAIGDSDDVEEERRVLYVALTRAQDELILTRRSYNRWAQPRYRQQLEAEEAGGDEAGQPLQTGSDGDPLEAAYFFNELPAQLIEERDRTGRPADPALDDTAAPRGRIIRFGIDLD